ncbi:Ribosomal lysine N-methyltransferase 4 [Lecanicillium sp. MT-2017a]|nr:Ribosomal lysine N-methyltransferase 4 [Lecanicillium sp. MT-2017a]
MSAASFDELTARFLAWFKALPGATFSDAIDIKDLRGRRAGRGIVAVQDIAPETTLFTIPRKAIVNVETSDLRKKLPALFEEDDVADDDGHGDEDGDDTKKQQLDSWTSLILIMMYEFLLDDQSSWKSYFEVLPESFDTPMFWSENELRELQASATVGKIGREAADDMFRGTLLPAIRGNPDVFVGSSQRSDDELVTLAHRMGSTIMAYAFDLENDEEDDDEEDGWVEDREGKAMMGMVPMADIMNADAEFNAHVNHGDDNLTVTALRPIKAGEEILNYYGPHPNSELLRRYGYVTPRHSRYDVVEIPWPLVEEALSAQLNISPETLAKVHADLDEELEDTFVLERECPEVNSDGTFTAAATAPEIPADLTEQLKEFLKGVRAIDASLVPDKRKRDEISTAVVGSVLESLSAQYPTSIEQDEGLLQAGGMDERAKMAVAVRLGEKILLREALAVVGGSDGSNKRARTE